MVELGLISIHFRYRKLTDAELRGLALSLFEISEMGARELISIDVDVAVDVEEASIKARSKIVAGAILVGGFLSQYGSIRQGAEYLARDLYAAGNFITKTVKQQLEVPSSDVIATRRSATFSRRVKRIFEEVERGRMTSDEAMRQLVKVLDPDSEGAVPPEVIEEFRKEVEAARENAPTELLPHVLTGRRESRRPGGEPPILREKFLRPRRLRIQRRDGEITIDEVD